MDGTEVEEFLEHHGIRGMKWGVRNASPSLDRISRVRNGTEARKAKRAEKKAEKFKKDTQDAKKVTDVVEKVATGNLNTRQAIDGTKTAGVNFLRSEKGQRMLQKNINNLKWAISRKQSDIYFRNMRRKNEKMFKNWNV